MEMQNKSKNSNIILFIIIAYGITWLLWISALLTGYKEIDFAQLLDHKFSSTKEIIQYILFRLAVYGPFIASIFLSIKNNNIKNIFKKIFKIKVKPLYYLFALALPAIIGLTSVLADYLVSGSSLFVFRLAIPLSSIPLLILFQLFTSGLEEPG